jgi:hypothetical protein
LVGEFAESDPDELEAAEFGIGRRSPFEAAEIGLRVTMSRKPAATTVHFEIRVDPADLMIEQRDGRYRGDLDVAAALYSEGFLKKTWSTKRVDINLTQAQLDEAAKAGVVIPMDLAVGDGTQKVRVMVFDRRLQALGSVTIPIN